MTVIDASVVVDALVGIGPHGDAARDELRPLTVLEEPSIFSAEAASALRRLVQRGQLSAVRASAALRDVCMLRTVRYPFEPFAPRVWELRETLTPYDAWYVALAEWLETELVTADRALARAAGPRCPVRIAGRPRVVPPGGQ